ncbi:MAG: acyltransferase family protein [Sphingomonas bacterium]|nr:acyltransferase family protein [Sphingomonas bacterium]
MRGLSALVVLVCHYRWFFAREVRDWRSDAPLPFYDWLWPIYDHGGVAVQMFWILSGFVFMVAYGGKGQSLDQREFWVHRLARLYPLHLATLAVVAALQIVSVQLTGRWTVEGNNDLPHFVAQLFFAQTGSRQRARSTGRFGACPSRY